MKHLDLFSGIGGFALAADRAYGNVEHTFVEIDPFCQGVLKKHWPEAEVHGDIRQFLADTGGEEPHGVSNVGREEVSTTWDLLTGGFPCQPFSTAGRRRGTDDDRYLWPEMLECIKQFKPTWIIGENVSGFATWNEGLVFETVCSDLENEGYEVWPLVIPACAVGAPHKRDRVWIVAHANSRPSQTGNGTTEVERLHVPGYWGSDTGTNWPEVATRLCRMDDGIPLGLDGDGKRKYTSRGKRLKALGNAIVPQIAEQIMRAIKPTV